MKREMITLKWHRNEINNNNSNDPNKKRKHKSVNLLPFLRQNRKSVISLSGDSFIPSTKLLRHNSFWLCQWIILQKMNFFTLCILDTTSILPKSSCTLKYCNLLVMLLISYYNGKLNKLLWLLNNCQFSSIIYQKRSFLACREMRK